MVVIFSSRAAARLSGGIQKIQPLILKATGAALLIGEIYLTCRDTLVLF